MPTATPSLLLEYAPTRPRRRVRRWIVAAVLILVAGWAVVHRDAISTEAQIRFREWQCRHMQLPADQVVYSSVPADVARLRSDPRYVLIPGSGKRANSNPSADAVVLRTQACLLEWNRLTRNNCQNRPAVFFGPMTTPGGRQVVTSIYWGPATQHSVTYERKSPFARPEKLRDTCLASIYYLVHDQSGRIRVHPPYVDKANTSRLIIPLDISGRRIDIHGVLRDDGTMLITVPEIGP